MTIRKFTYHISFIIIFCIINICSHAQSIEIKTDKNQILIGEQIEYDLLITIPTQGYSINFGMPDSIPHFETLINGGYDTMSTNGSISLRRKFVFTSFDSGAWYIPALPVTLEINNDVKKFMTDSVLINVGYSAADTTNELRDIKPIMEIKVVDYFWIYVTGILLLVLIAGFFIYNYIQKRRNRPLPVLHSTLSPYEEAMEDLKALSQYSLNIPADVKQYHSQLGFILKRYFSRITDNNLLNKTTGDLLLQMKQQQVDSGLISTIAQTLRIGDAVKFAKYIPAVPESENCFTELKLAIEKIEKNKPNKNQ